MVDVEGFPFAVGLEYADDGVALVVAHPEVAFVVVAEGCDSHEPSVIGIVGQDGSEGGVVT